MIAWREKFKAFGIHFLVTLALAAVAAWIIFGIWFPAPFAAMVGGYELFFLVVGCDLALGPLMSLVIYNSRKSRRELILDYTLVAIVQLGALVYGVSIVSGSRPVYVAFSQDRFEVVSAADITPKELAAATDPKFRKLPWSGPQVVAVFVPLAQHNDALFEALKGNEEHMRPKFYVPYESQLPAVLKSALPLAELEKRHPKSTVILAEARRNAGRPDTDLRWLPVRCRLAFWTVFIDATTGAPVSYVNFDPY